MPEPQLLTHIPYASEPGTPVDEIRGTASRNEVLSLTFSLFAENDLDVTLELTSLTGRDGRKLDADLHVVHQWAQSGLGVYQSAATQVNELLLKSDSVRFRDGYRRRCDSPWHVHRSRSRYLAPDVKLTGDVTASLIAKKSKQFWISVNVDAACAPGEYRGHLNVRRKGRADVHVSIMIDVLPVTLVEPAQDLMLWYRGTLNCHHPHHYVSRKNFTAQLSDIYRHGFRSISFWETDKKRMQQAIDIAHDAGFAGNLVLDAYREDVWSNVDFRGLTPVVYVADEPDAGPFGEMDRTIELVKTLHAKNIPTMTSLLHSRSMQKLDSDIVSIFAPANLQYLMNHGGHGASRERTYFYWQAHMEKPLVHRLLAGAFLWTSGAAGISPYCYQHLPGFPFSPFDDFDSWDPKQRAPAGKVFRDHLATYPSRRGPIPTLQWKGMADGIVDLRYLATREAALRNAETSGDTRRAETARRIRGKRVELIDLIRPESLELMSDSNPLPADALSATAFTEMRASLMKDILTLCSDAC